MARLPRETERRERKKRIPPGSPRLKLSAEGIRPGFRGYWAKPEQFAELEDAGYSFVKKDSGVRVGTDRTEGTDLGSLISRSGGGEDKLYLMEISEEFYAENEEIKQAEIDQTEKAIFEPTSENQYISERSVKQR